MQKIDLLSDRQRLVADIQAEARSAAPWTGAGAISATILEVMARIPRHEFVPTVRNSAAYDNAALPIGYGQTISQPYIVALMTDLLQLQPTDVVLEVGTGSGYQAAVLAGLVKQVYTIEIVAILAQQAAQRLARLGYTNVEVLGGDGRAGLPQHAPYDAIIVTAAPQQIPAPLIEQLKAGGYLVIPVGSAFDSQDLLLIEKRLDGTVTSKTVLPVAFVPLTAASIEE